MGQFLDNLKFYFENTPSEEIDKEWKEIESLNEIGPDVIEYANYVREYFLNKDIENIETLNHLNNGEDKF